MQYEPPYGAPGANDSYINGDPSIARQGSIIPAQAVEFPQREITNLIVKAGLTPTDQDLYQLTRGVRRQFLNFCVDTGQANAMSVALDPPLQAYRQGMPLRVLVAHTNTGNCTINVNNLGNRPVVRTGGSQLQPSDLLAGMIAQLVDDGTRFQLTNFQGATGGGTITNNYTVHIPYAEDSSPTPNAIVVSFTPAITAVNSGDLIEVRVANQNTGAVTIAINAMTPAMPVRRNDGQPLQSQDLLAGEAILLEWNHTYWQLLRLVRSQVYFKLTANLTLYCDPAGNDANDGHDPQHAFRHIQAAINYVQQSFLIAGRTVTIQLAPGSYWPITSDQAIILIQNLPGTIIVRGDPNNKWSYVLYGPTAGQAPQDFVAVGVSGSGSNLYLIGVTVAAQNTESNLIECNYSGSLWLSDIVYGGINFNGACIAAFGGQIGISNTHDLATNPAAFIGIYDGALTAGLWYTLINTHGANFSYAFVVLTYGYCALSYGWCQFAGAAWGYRYDIFYNSVLNTGGAPSDWLPGSAPGGADASSVYG